MASLDEGDNPIITNNQILLCNTKTQDITYVPLDDRIAEEFGLVMEPEKEISQVETDPLDNETENEEQRKMWTPQNTLFLNECVRKFDKQFSQGIKKNVWQKVADSCQHLHQKLSAKHCETKWKSLLRTYKSIILNNNTSGQKKRYWEFYEPMHRIMFKKTEITPPATCSSSSGLKINQDSVEEPKEDTKKEKFEKQEAERPESSFSKKRKQKGTEAEKRHNEKMQKLDRFNDLFEKMIGKMPETHT